MAGKKKETLKRPTSSTRGVPPGGVHTAAADTFQARLQSVDSSRLDDELRLQRAMALSMGYCNSWDTQQTETLSPGADRR